MRVLQKLTCIFIFLMHNDLNAQIDWDLKTDKEGIKVWSRTDPNSKFNQLKLECKVEASLSSLVALLQDVPAYPEWVYHNKSAKILKKVSDREMYFYEQIQSPFGTSNRDFAGHVIISQDADSKRVHVSVKSVPEYVPEDKDFVRVPLSDETWTIVPINKNSSRIEYQLDINPGGSVPAWLVNSFSEKGPFESFHNLRKQVNLDKYKKAILPFIVNATN